jgi:hypothetical protein
MSSGRGYGVPVDIEHVSSALESTRLMRLALNVLWNGLDELPDDTTSGPAGDALASIHDRINTIESTNLRRFGQAEHYLVIRPISPASPPPPEIMEKITAAVRTLAELGMLAGQNDACYRDQ